MAGKTTIIRPGDLVDKPTSEAEDATEDPDAAGTTEDGGGEDGDGTRPSGSSGEGLGLGIGDPGPAIPEHVDLSEAAKVVRDMKRDTPPADTPPDPRVEEELERSGYDFYRPDEPADPERHPEKEIDTVTWDRRRPDSVIAAGELRDLWDRGGKGRKRVILTWRSAAWRHDWPGLTRGRTLRVKAVLTALAEWAKPCGASMFPSTEVLAERASICSGRVGEYLREAEERGWLFRVRCRRANRRYSSNLYVASIPRGIVEPDAEGDE